MHEELSKFRAESVQRSETRNHAWRLQARDDVEVRSLTLARGDSWILSIQQEM
jgi:hypothetical protein